MIIAIAETNRVNGTPLLLLGLSRENVKRMMEGKPIFLTRATHGPAIPEKLNIGIMFGETEDAIVEQLRQIGTIGPETQFRDEHGTSHAA